MIFYRLWITMDHSNSANDSIWQLCFSPGPCPFFFLVNSCEFSTWILMIQHSSTLLRPRRRLRKGSKILSRWCWKAPSCPCRCCVQSWERSLFHVVSSVEGKNLQLIYNWFTINSRKNTTYSLVKLSLKTQSIDFAAVKFGQGRNWANSADSALRWHRIKSLEDGPSVRIPI